jgi:hypothetical protein
MTETPAFARTFPAETSAAVEAFARGDFGGARRLLPPLLASDNPATRRAAEHLQERMRPPALAIYLLILSGLLLAGLTGYWIHKRGYSSAAPALLRFAQHEGAV